jgi:hypothetical protein
MNRAVRITAAFFVSSSLTRRARPLSLHPHMNTHRAFGSSYYYWFNYETGA